MKFTIYGSGCAKCKQLTANAQDAANAKGLAYDIEKVTDTNAIIDAGIMRTPHLRLMARSSLKARSPVRTR